MIVLLSDERGRPRDRSVALSRGTMFLARPKSVYLGAPSAVRSTLAGFRSRAGCPVDGRNARRGPAFPPFEPPGWPTRGRWQVFPPGFRLQRTPTSDKEWDRRQLHQVWLPAIHRGRRWTQCWDAQTCDGFRFAAKAFQVLAAGEDTGQNHLDGHQPIEVLLPRLVNDTHAAAFDFFQELQGRIATRRVPLRACDSFGTSTAAWTSNN